MSTTLKRPPPKPGQKITIQDLYPELTPEQQVEAEYHLKRYFSVIKRIYERTHNLTTSDRADTILESEGE